MNLCRNGHDLDTHGRRMKATKTRPAHNRCMECRRLARERENSMDRTRRASKRPPPLECRNGHDRSRSKEVTDVGGRTYLRCLECDRIRAEVQRAVERNRR